MIGYIVPSLALIHIFSNFLSGAIYIFSVSVSCVVQPYDSGIGFLYGVIHHLHIGDSPVLTQFAIGKVSIHIRDDT